LNVKVVFIETECLKFVGSVLSELARNRERVVGREFVGVIDKVSQVPHEELEVRNLVSLFELDVEKPSSNSSLNSCLDHTHGVNFLNSTIGLFIELFGNL
jgi:hypothetical protein